MGEERFDPAGENCLAMAIDEVTAFFGYELADISAVKSVKNIRQLIAHFETLGLKVSGFYHPFFLLNPKYWKLFLTRRFRMLRKLAPPLKGEKYAYVYFTSGFELYGIHEFWNHFVVEFYDGERIYYDRYGEIIKNAHPELAIKIPEHENFVNKIVSICLIVEGE